MYIKTSVKLESGTTKNGKTTAEEEQVKLRFKEHSALLNCFDGFKEGICGNIFYRNKNANWRVGERVHVHQLTCGWNHGCRVSRG